MRLFDYILRKPTVYWRKVFEHLGSLKGFLLRIPLMIAGSVTKEIAIAAYLFAKEVFILRKRSGLLFTSLYLKQCNVLLQQYYGGQVKRGLSGVYVKTTRSGLPRIIPSFHRKLIMVRDSRADRLVKMYLSWFGLSKLICLAKPVTFDTFSSIEDSPTEEAYTGTRYVVGEAQLIGAELFNRYMPWIAQRPVLQGLRWVPTWKSVPSMSLRKVKPNSVFTVLKSEFLAFIQDRKLEDAFGLSMNPTILYPQLIRYAMEENPLDFRSLAWPTIGYYPFGFLIGTGGVLSRLIQGRLTSVVEGGGKRRLFVIGNYIKQRLLYPYHSWVMDLLKSFPQDGTFDQPAPLRHLFGLQDLYSFDLKSATDRWPVILIISIFQLLFDADVANAVGSACLGRSKFILGITKKARETCFAWGQPLGYYASWPLFSLSHHFVVWMAAERVFPGERFRAYALLGDDIVIGNSKVAKQYRSILDQMGVKISEQKSLISHVGALEFAKRFIIHKGATDLSPVSLKALLGSRSIFGLCEIRDQYKMKNLATFFRLAGAGYRVMGKIHHSLTPRWERIRIAFSKPGGSVLTPLDIWLGQGLPLSPYVYGKLCEKVRKHLKRKELKLPDYSKYSNDYVMAIEVTLIQEWLRMDLRNLLWHTTVALDLNSSLQDLLDEPFVETKWYRTNTDPQLLRFGLVWRLFDFAKDLIKSAWSPNILDPGRTPPNIPYDFIVVSLPVVGGMQYQVIRYDSKYSTWDQPSGVVWILGGMYGVDFILALSISN